MTSFTGTGGLHRRRAVLVWIAPLLLLVAGIAVQQLASLRPQFIEHYYSRGLYLYISRGISQLSRPFSFSVAEFLIVVLPLVGLGMVLFHTRRLLHRGTSLPSVLLAQARGLIWFLGVFLLLFLVLFGLNYHRLPLSRGLALSERAATSSELEQIAIHVISEINRSFADSGGTEATPSRRVEEIDTQKVFESIERAYEATALLDVARQGTFGPPKPVYGSRLMMTMGIAGIYSPFTGEPNYNALQPASELPFSVAHEKAHQRGFAREDEANFIAFIVCMRADDPYVRYSGFLRGLRVLAPLQAAVPIARYREIVGALAPGVRADLQASAEIWRRARSPRLGDAAERANNTYLRANNVRSGVRNYGEVVSLIISYYLTYPPG